MEFEDFIRLLLSAVTSVMFPIVTVHFVCRYVRELWVFFTRRSDYDALKKSKMTWGEFDDGPELSTAQRLIVGYPSFIGASGLFTFFIIRGALDGSWPFF